MKKLFITFLTIVLFVSNICYADVELDLENLEDFSFSEVSTVSSIEPLTNSNNIAVIDRKTLSILYEKNSYNKVAMASTTKIITCILALENCSLKDTVTVSHKAATVTGSTLGLVENMKITINDLLYGLMLRSGNDCAIAIAEHISGSVEEFSILMNKKAFELGLFSTNFVTPHGLDDDNHYTTAYDLAILTDYALKNELFKKIVSTKRCTINFNGYPRELSNTNELLDNIEGVYGVKTGFTFNAGRCLVSSCKRGDLDIIVVVLGANTKKIRTQDSINLINYIFTNYKYVDVSSTIKESFNHFLEFYENKFLLEKTTTLPNLKLENLNNYNFPILSNNVKLSTKISILDKFSSYTKKNSIVGTLYLYNDNNLICKNNILLENTLFPSTWKYYFKNIIINLYNY